MGWWRNRSRLGKTGIVIGGLIVLLIIIVVGSSGGEEATTRTTTAATATTAPNTTNAEFATTTTTEPSTTTTTTTLTVALVRVVDGDTIEVKMSDGRQEKVRYIGINAPETGQTYASQATSYNKRLLSTGPLKMEFDVQERDKYGRLLAYVWAGDVFVNRRMVLDGYAQVSTYPPNIKYESDFVDAQQKARSAQAGLWAPTTTTTKATATAPEDEGITVYVTATGNKYHNSGCRYLSKSKIPMSLSVAKAQGYQPCSVCDPPA